MCVVDLLGSGGLDRWNEESNQIRYDLREVSSKVVFANTTSKRRPLTEVLVAFAKPVGTSCGRGVFLRSKVSRIASLSSLPEKSIVRDSTQMS